MMAILHNFSIDMVSILRLALASDDLNNLLKLEDPLVLVLDDRPWIVFDNFDIDISTSFSQYSEKASSRTFSLLGAPTSPFRLEILLTNYNKCCCLSTVRSKGFVQHRFKFYICHHCSTLPLIVHCVLELADLVLLLHLGRDGHRGEALHPHPGHRGHRAATKCEQCNVKIMVEDTLSI